MCTTSSYYIRSTPSEGACRQVVVYWSDWQGDGVIHWRVWKVSTCPSRPAHYVFLCRNKHFESLYLDGKISLELIPQGTLVGRLHAHASGFPAIWTPTGASTAVEEGSIPLRLKEGGHKAGVAIPGIKKEAREFNGRRFILEPAIAGDVAFEIGRAHV